MKKLAIGFVVLLVLLCCGVGYLWSNLDHIVKSAIEKYGSEATQTKVSVSSVKLSLTTGQGSVSGLSVANPKPFSAPKAFDMDSISVTVDTGSIRGSGPIIIHEIDIEKPEVVYAVASDGSNNLQALKQNAMNYASSAGGKSEPSDDSATTEAKGQGRKVIIEELYIRDGTIQIASDLLKGRALTANLPTIHLTNIGKSTGGATTAQVAQQVLDSITSSASKVANNALKNSLGTTLKDAAGKNLNDVAAPLKGLLR